MTLPYSYRERNVVDRTRNRRAWRIHPTTDHSHHVPVRRIKEARRICRERGECGVTARRGRKRARHICRVEHEPPVKRHAPFCSLLYHLVARGAVYNLPLSAVPADEQSCLAPRKNAVVIRVVPERNLDVVACRRVEFKREREHARIGARRRKRGVS